MGSEGPGRDAGAGRGPEGGSPGDRTEGAEGLPLRSLEAKILLSAGLILAGIAVAGRYGMLPGAACGAAIAYGNFHLIRRILERAFAGGGAVGKGFAVQYAVKFLALAALVYLAVNSGRIDVLGFLLGLSALFLGVLLEGISRAGGIK